MTPGRPTAYPYLEHYSEPGGPAERVLLIKMPFTIGRSSTNDWIVYSNVVSSAHAEIFSLDGGYAVRDLSSTNGTFLNGRRVSEERLTDGDILHLSHLEFRFCSANLLPPGETSATVALPDAEHDSVIRGTQRLRKLIDTEAAEIIYQPILDLDTRHVIGYEALARGTSPDLSRSPGSLFQLAEQCQMSVEMSQLFRRLAVINANRLPDGVKVFLNVHGRELAEQSFIDSLEALEPYRTSAHPLVLEVAESSVTDVAAMTRHRKAFAALGYEFAYDDFGAGQARLIELADIPPHYLKLDITVVHGIETAEPRQKVVRALLGVVQALGVEVIGEGIETEEVAAVCRELGCQFGQGFLFGGRI